MDFSAPPARWTACYSQRYRRPRASGSSRRRASDTARPTRAHAHAWPDSANRRPADTTPARRAHRGSSPRRPCTTRSTGAATGPTQSSASVRRCACSVVLTRSLRVSSTSLSACSIVCADQLRLAHPALALLDIRGDAAGVEDRARRVQRGAEEVVGERRQAEIRRRQQAVGQDAARTSDNAAPSTPHFRRALLDVGVGDEHVRAVQQRVRRQHLRHAACAGIRNVAGIRRAAAGRRSPACAPSTPRSGSTDAAPSTARAESRLQIAQLVLRARDVELRRQSVMQALVASVFSARARICSLSLQNLQLRLRPAQIDIRRRRIRREREPQLIRRPVRGPTLAPATASSSQPLAAEHVGRPARATGRRRPDAHSRAAAACSGGSRRRPRSRSSSGSSAARFCCRQILRLLHALDRGLHVEIAGQHRFHQLMQHRIAELRPTTHAALTVSCGASTLQAAGAMRLTVCGRSACVAGCTAHAASVSTPRSRVLLSRSVSCHEVPQ